MHSIAPLDSSGLLAGPSLPRIINLMRPHLIESNVTLSLGALHLRVGPHLLLGKQACIFTSPNTGNRLIPMRQQLFSVFVQHYLACLYLTDTQAGVKYQFLVPTNCRAQSSQFMLQLKGLLIFRRTTPFLLGRWEFPPTLVLGQNPLYGLLSIPTISFSIHLMWTRDFVLLL